MTDDLYVDDGLTIPGSELLIRASRSGGPGGQHVNTTASKVELRWDICRSGVLDRRRRELLLERLGARLTDEGVLILHASEHRSQHRNREAALARLATIVAEAMRIPSERRPTRPTRAAQRRRLDEKRARSTTKGLRRPPED